MNCTQRSKTCTRGGHLPDHPGGTIPSEAQIFRETITGGIEGTSREIFTGQNATGTSRSNLSPSAGSSALPPEGHRRLAYTPASSVYTMKDYVDKGGDSVLGAFGQAVKDVAGGTDGTGYHRCD